MIGDYVSVKPDDPIQPLYIARVMYMWENQSEEKMFHADWFRSANIIIICCSGYLMKCLTF